MSHSPALSVVVVAPAGMTPIRRTIECLAAQTARDAIEVLIVAASAAQIDPGALGAERFAALRIVAVGPIKTRGDAAAAGIHAATAPVVALVEDHSYPEPGWAAALLAAHAGPWAGVGPCVMHANANTRLSRVDFWLSYALFTEPQQAGSRNLLPFHNSAYKRDVLTGYGARLGGLLRWEANLQADLLANGHQLYLEPAARTHHANVSRLRSSLGIHFHKGRNFGGTRAAREQWPRWRRVGYAVAMPLFPVMQWRHIVPNLRRTGVTMRDVVALGPELAALLAAMAAGEALGYLTGTRDALDRLETYELNRAAHLSRRKDRRKAGTRGRSSRAGYPRTMTLALGDTAPSFALADTEGVEHAVPIEPAPIATVVVVTCNHCPYVIAWNPRLRAVAEDYAPRGVRLLGINSNDATIKPADSAENMARFVRDQAWPIPYLHDESQEVARALGAEVTPHVFVFDAEHRLRYRGAPDGNHADESQGAVWLRDALDAVLNGDEPAQAETPPRGCSVKWKG